MRLRRYEIFDDYFLRQFVQGSEHKAHIVMENGVPETAKLYKMEHFPSSRLVVIWFEDDSFPEIDSGPIVVTER